jgi:hypothetical protein
MLRETATLNKIMDVIKRAENRGVTQKSLAADTGFSQPYISRVLVNLVKAKAIHKQDSQPQPGGLPGAAVFKYNPTWSGFDEPMAKQEYGFDVTFGERSFPLEDPFQRLVTHKGANEYLTGVGNFRSAIGNTLVFFLGNDILSEREPDWDAYRSALQLAMSFINTQAQNGSFNPESSDASAFRKAAGFYA